MNKFKIFPWILCILAVAVLDAWAGPDDTVIVKTITDMAKSITDFPRTRDVQSVLKFFTKDYTEISDGEYDSLKGIETILTDLEEQINLGLPVGISFKVTDVKARTIGTIGWGTYNYVVKIGSGGEVLEEEQGKCTFICKKVGLTWLIHHQHSSTPRPEPQEQNEQPRE